MKNFRKFTLIFVLCITVLLPNTIYAHAEGNTQNPISIVLSGNKLDIPNVTLAENGSVYAPYDSLFSALGAKASFDSSAQAVTAVYGNNKITIPLSDNEITVSVGAIPQKIYSNAPAYKESNTGVVYVKVKYAAHAMGYVVSWDSSTRTVNLTSIDNLISDSKATYTVIDKFLAYSRSLSDTTHALTGNFSAKAVIDSSDVSTPINISGTVSGIADSSSENMSMNMKTNLSDYTNEIIGNEDNLVKNAMARSLIEKLDNFNFDMIFNIKSGMLYMKSPLCSTAFGVPDGTWMSLDYNKLFSGETSYSSVMQASQSGNFRDYLSTILKSMCLNDTGDETADCLKVINSIVSDQAMKKDNGNYVSSYTYKQNSESIKLNMTFDFSGDNCTGCSINCTGNLSDDGNFSLICAVNSGNGSMKMKLSVPDELTIDFDSTFAYSATSRTPDREPATDKEIVSLNKLLAEHNK